jgi:hypothetical protein
MNGKPIIYIDQFGSKYFCYNVKDLKEVHYLSGKVSKMFVDSKDGKTYHVGYVVGQHWLDAYVPFRKEVKQ